MKTTRLVALAILASAALIAAPKVGAASITFQLDHEFSGATPPAGTALPWLTAKFTDTETAGTVELTLSTPGLIGSEFVTGWYFNLDPALAPGDLEVQLGSGGAGTVTWSDVKTGVNAFPADGGGRYDILFEFQTSAGEGRFGVGDEVVFNLSMTGLSADSFNYLAAPHGGHGPFHTAAHIQGIGGDDEESGWIAPIPEPSTVIAGLLLLAPMAFGAARALRRKQAA